MRLTRIRANHRAPAITPHALASAGRFGAHQHRAKLGPSSPIQLHDMHGFSQTPALLGSQRFHAVQSHRMVTLSLSGSACPGSRVELHPARTRCSSPLSLMGQPVPPRREQRGSCEWSSRGLPVRQVGCSHCILARCTSAAAQRYMGRKATSKGPDMHLHVLPWTWLCIIHVQTTSSAGRCSGHSLTYIL